MLRALLTPRWLGALALATLYAVLALQLGQWQYGRHVAKVERNERISAHYTAAAVPVESVLGTTAMPIGADWTHVTASGSFLPQSLLVRGRTVEGNVGYEVLAPLRLGSGAVVLIDRGWIPLGERGARDIPRYAPAPQGPVTLTGWIRPGERSRGAGATPGQLASIDLVEAAAALDVPLLGGYVQLGSLSSDRTTASAGEVPVVPLGKPDRSLGTHQAYAYQWWLTLPLGFVLVILGIRREVQPQHSADALASRRRTSRIWDDEDE